VRKRISFSTAVLGAALTLVEGEARAEEPHRLEWTYPRFRPVEYVAAGLATGAGLYLEGATRGNPDNQLRGGILLDEVTRDVLVAGSADTRDTVATVSDYLWHSTQYFPVLDSLITPLVSDRGNLDVAMQMTLINWQVQGVAFLITRATHRVIGRSRPVRVGCADDETYDPICAEDPRIGATASFLSGHTSMAFAGAALTCSHHISLPLYGGNAADAGICALTLVSASTIGVLRIVSDRHWWTDVMAGAGVGLATGFGLPFLLHYTHRTPSTVTLLPMVGPTTAGVSVMAQP
jgi:membrane-associated phospholipid phosphatase